MAYFLSVHESPAPVLAHGGNNHRRQFLGTTVAPTSALQKRFKIEAKLKQSCTDFDTASEQQQLEEMTSTTGAGNAPPKAGGKAMPAGVEKTLQSTLRYSVGMNVAGKVADQDAVLENIDKFFQTPTSDSLPKGFTKISKPVFDCTPVALGGAFMTKRKKPIVPYFVDDDDDDLNGKLVLALRGDRKQTETMYAKVDNGLVGPLTSSIYATAPRSACNFHPWFSSILFSAAGAWEVTSTSAHAINTTNNMVSKVSSAIAKNNIVLAMCVPKSVAVEAALHKLAHEKPISELSQEDADKHEDEWYKSLDKRRFRNCADLVLRG